MGLLLKLLQRLRIQVPFKSKAKQRFLESKASPLTEAQKREWESKTNFKSLSEKVATKFANRKKKGA